MSYKTVTKEVNTSVPVDPNQPKGPKKNIRLRDAEAYEFSLDVDGISDAVKLLGAGTCAQLINTQSMTNAMNKIRSEFNKAPSEESLTKRAWEIITASPDMLAAIAQHPGDMAWIMENLINPTIAKLKAEAQAAKAGLVVGDSTPEEPEATNG